MFRWDKFKPVCEVVPAKKQGVAEVRHVVVSKEDADFINLRAAIHGERPDAKAGKFAHLLVNGGLMMSDTPMEKRTSAGFIDRACGDVLVFGLGLGMILPPLFAEREVKSVTVVEKHQDVIDLVAPYYTSKKPFRVLAGNAFTWKPEKGEKFGAIFIDIWPDICTDNLKDIATLKRRCARFKTTGGFVEAWVEGELRYRNSRGW